MSSSTSPVTITTAPSNTTSVTKSKEQILIQSSGAMIAVIVIGIIIILAVVLIILKTYNRRTHTSRLLGDRAGSRPRPKMSQSTVNGSVPLNSMGVNSVSSSIINSNSASENGFQLPRVELSSAEGNHMEQFSTTSDYSESTVVTIHETPSQINT
ncbi:noncompact myelin-associated protein [Girardinichthys multiradiatus]|uniref:noncompact myelin-associated protein n=1 Tax=Girardinichthys multiradiatus TaxID=208333 RepID=UPI001FAE0914|nr:noncompact myelin-associated protein [Girardinichthys multiradiatus]